MTVEHLGLMIQSRTEKFKNLTAMRHKSENGWQEMTYRDMGRRIQQVALALISLGVKPGDRIALFSPNRPEWTIADFAILSIRAVTVPIYATNTRAQAAYIVDDAGADIVFTGDRAQYQKIRSISRGKTIITFDDINGSTEKDTIHFDKLRAMAHTVDPARLRARRQAARSQDPATIVYTSGTTGDPKGAVLTHANFFHQIRAVDAAFTVGPEDRSLCFLPLSHVYERLWSFYVFNRGAQNNYLADPRQVIDYLSEVRPTAMVSVPRLYEKIYAAVGQQIERAGTVKKMLFKWALAKGLEYGRILQQGEKVPPGLRAGHAIADRLVLSRIRTIVGGRKNFFSAGGAPLSREIEEFFFAAGILVCQGYGLTETAPMITCNTPANFRFGTVGRPVPDCDVKIAGDGEILVRGGQVMAHYHTRPKETEEAITDGWFHTGDVGAFDADGYLKITDRIKDLIITSVGKNIAPQRIENLIGQDIFIDQVAVFGDRRKYISALVVPAFEQLEAWARAKGIVPASRSDLVAHPNVIAFLKSRIEARSKDLAPFENIKKFTMLPYAFTEEQGEVTPTLKIRRKFIYQRYRKLIDAMY